MVAPHTVPPKTTGTKRSAPSETTAIKSTINQPSSMTSSVFSNSSVTTSTNKQKRPYRRTKRPKHYCDKSTVTTASPAVNTPVNVYDAVMGESEDLLRAAMEAQALGRLKMASAYLLLLHARLVGLGKRFDRSSILCNHDEEQLEDADDDNSVANSTIIEQDEAGLSAQSEDMDTTTAQEEAAVEMPARSTQLVGKATGMVETSAADTANETTRRGNASVTVTPKKAVPEALDELTSILPSNIEMDTVMMEHLARAAVALHHERTGRKQTADGLLAGSVHDTGAMLSLAVCNSMEDDENPVDNGGLKDSMLSSATGTIAWTKSEQLIVDKAMKESDKFKHTPRSIAKQLQHSKTEAQVRAYMKNMTKKKTTKALDDAMVEADLNATPGGTDEGILSPKKRGGGRGRKPPTAAMNTVPNANLDARSMLQGGEP